MSELSNIELNYKEIIEIVITNISKMFVRRMYIDDMDKLIPVIIKEINTNKSYNFSIGDKKVSINIMNQELKNISKGSPVDDYLGKNTDHHKFLLVKYFSKKTYKQVNEDYLNAEVFNIHEFLEDIPSKLFIPEHTLIIGEKREELLETFSLKEFGRIYSTDMMVRYYGAKLNDIFRISRPNINSGMSIYYRIVVPGSLEIFA
jgi:DNA-directed RNA polymerase subunit H (RpoH/RPB5)